MAEAEINNTSLSLLKRKFIPLLFSSFIFLFIIAFNFTDNPSGWYQQNMPDIGSRQITNVKFIDSLTGYACAYRTSDTSYILKSTNGGDSWQIIYRSYFYMQNFQFLNKDTGYVCGAYIFKTTNGGFNWIQLNSASVSPEQLYVLNNDTIWFISSNSLVGGVFRTTNGGVNWTQQLNAGTQNPDKIYMYNSRIGFISNQGGHPDIKKTTNGGFNWSVCVDSQSFSDIRFIDSLTGWRNGASVVYKTTNGGTSWFTQVLPYGPGLNLGTVYKFSLLNRDTLWAVGGLAIVSGGGARGIIYRTTNGGDIWQYQLPDTAIHINTYRFIQFINNKSGWAYAVTGTGIHTTTGGDPQWTRINNHSNEIPSDFYLSQNFPNPFNPTTTISYELKSSAYVKLTIFDITGKEMQVLLDQREDAGKKSILFNGSAYASGVYFYRLDIITKDASYSEVKKMILAK
jgi:photosystem II stability/assembly factor-like uncharacterized protein